jgi:hypothetical protein
LVYLKGNSQKKQIFLATGKRIDCPLVFIDR